jgi:hypothetical protein
MGATMRPRERLSKSARIFLEPDRLELLGFDFDASGESSRTQDFEQGRE